MWTVTYSICSFIVGLFFGIEGHILYEEIKGRKNKK